MGTTQFPMPTGGGPADETQVTFQMKQAGVAALGESSGSYGPAELVEAVYTAMGVLRATRPGAACRCRQS
jgi:hypothetical protein